MLEKIEKMMMLLANVALAIMTSWVFFDASSRYLFNAPIPGTLEVTEEYLIVIVVFFAMSYTQRLNGHVSVDIFQTYMPAKILPAVNQINRITSLIFAAFVVYSGMQQFVSAVKLHSVSRGVLAYPLAPAYLIMVFGMALLGWRLIQEIFTRPDKRKCDK